MSTATHPAWCALEPACTAYTGEGIFDRQHRGEPVTFTAPAVAITLTLFQASPGWPTEPHITATVSDTLSDTVEAGVTLAVSDAWRLADTLTCLLDRASS